MASQYAEDLLRMRALLIVTSLQFRRDVKCIELVRNYNLALQWQPLADLMIDADVWQYAVEQRQYDP